MQIPVARSGGTATRGTQYDFTGLSPSSGILEITPGFLADSIVLEINDDTRNEPDETYTVEMRSPIVNALPGSVTSHTLTIQDNDSPPTVAFHYADCTKLPAGTTVKNNTSVIESNSKYEIELQLTNRSDWDVTVTVNQSARPRTWTTGSRTRWT